MELFSKINWVDVLAIILVLRTGYVSLQDGLSHEIFPLVGSLCMLVLSLHYYGKIALFIHDKAQILPVDVLNVVIFVMIAFITGVIFRLLKLIMDKIVKVSWNPALEKFGGLVAGLVRGIILASIVLTIIALIPLSYLRHSVREKSLTGGYFLKIGPALNGRLGGALPEPEKLIVK